MTRIASTASRSWPGRFFPVPLLLVLGIAAASADPPRSATTGLVGLWRFTPGDGKTVADGSGHGNPGVIEQATLAALGDQRVLNFDGLGGQVRIDLKNPLGIRSTLTAAIWTRSPGWRTHNVIFGIPNSVESWTTPVFGIYVADQSAVFGLQTSQGTRKVLVESKRELPRGAWIHLAGTYDGQRARLYENGQLVAEQPAQGTLVFNGKPLLIGAGLGTNKPPWRGQVAELRVYDRALSADELRALVERERPALAAFDPPTASQRDRTVMVETHGNSPEGDRPWKPRPTRVLELLDGFPARTPPSVDRYGGRLDRPAERASGFFRVQVIDGRHHLIDPEGRRFFHVGINAVQERRPAADWAQTITTQLRDLGFNGLGNWQGTGLRAVRDPLVYVRRHDFLFEFVRRKKLVEPAAGTTGFINRCPPVFHPEFPAFCETHGQSLRDTANDPYLLGIMTDNEIQCPVDLLDRCLALDREHPDLKHGRIAAEAWLAARPGLTPATLTRRDRYDFIVHVFEQYYRVVVPIIRKYDPNHLYLGSRLNYRQGQFDNPAFWRMLAKTHDVVSVNYYSAWGPDAHEVRPWTEWSGKPILFTEWYAKAMDAPGLSNAKGAGWLVRTQEDRGKYFQHFALGALELPGVVGYHWFKYKDDPAESVALDSAGGSNKGMFNTRGELYLPLAERAKAVNRQVYPLIDFFDARARETSRAGKAGG